MSLLEGPLSSRPGSRNGIKSPVKLNIDVTIEKKKTKEHPHASAFGKSTIQLSGSLTTAKTIVTEETVQIVFPGEQGVRILRIIYDKKGQLNLPEKQRNGVFKLLQEQRSHLVDVLPVFGAERPAYLQDIQSGRFDLVASSHGAKVNNRLGFKGQYQDFKVNGVSDDLQLIRIWRTGEFLIYNKKTGGINRLRDKRIGRTKSFDKAYDILQKDSRVWTLKDGDPKSFYKTYLDKLAIQEHLERQHSLKADILKVRHEDASPGPIRPWSFSEADSTNYYREYLRKDALRGNLTERKRRQVKFNKFNLSTHNRYYQTIYPDAMLQQRGMPFDLDDALTEANLKCQVCKNYYDTRERCPHVMHCLHTCCKSCLRNRVRAEMVQCPVCNEVHEVPNNEIELLPEDHARQKLVKFFKVKNKAHEIGCDSCDPRNRATHRCRECDEFLCGVCTEAHKRTKVTKGHNIVSVDALRRSHLEEFHHKRTCPVPEHEDQPFSFYCYSKGCDIPICSMCAVNEHNKADGHDIRNINDVYIENKRQVESMLIDVKHKKNIADEAVQGIEDEIQNLYIKENATEEELDQAFLACQKQLEKRKNELKEKLAATSKAKKKGLESQLDKLIADKNSLDHASRFSSSILGYSDATEFLQMKDAIYNRLGELKEMDIDVRPHNKADIKFNAHKMLEGFQKFSHKLGEVWSSTAFVPNTKVQTFDVGLGREETALLITLHDYEKRPLAEPGVDIKVEVTNPIGRRTRAQVIDCTESEGAYKAIFQGTKIGDHRASVFVMGMPVIDSEIGFKVRRPGALEADVIRDLEGDGDRIGQKFDQSDREEEDGSGNKTVRGKAYRVFGDIICPDFSFDASACHTQNMVTTDGRTLKNVRGRVANIGTALKNYRGTLGTKPFSKAGRFYFEVVVYFFIKRQLRNDLIFEVAIARKSEIDKNYTVDGSPFAWTVCARRCPLCRTVCLMTFHNGVRLYHNPLTENSPPGTTLRTTIGFLIDMKSRQWFIVDAKNRRLFFRFKNIETTKPLWPVFGAYSTEYVSVSLALKTGRDIQAVPDIPADT